MGRKTIIAQIYAHFVRTQTESISYGNVCVLDAMNHRHGLDWVLDSSIPFWLCYLDTIQLMRKICSEWKNSDEEVEEKTNECSTQCHLQNRQKAHIIHTRNYCTGVIVIQWRWSRLFFHSFIFFLPKYAFTVRLRRLWFTKSCSLIVYVCSKLLAYRTHFKIIYISASIREKRSIYINFRCCCFFRISY